MRRRTHGRKMCPCARREAGGEKRVRPPCPLFASCLAASTSAHVPAVGPVPRRPFLREPRDLAEFWGLSRAKIKFSQRQPKS